MIEELLYMLKMIQLFFHLLWIVLEVEKESSAGKPFVPNSKEGERQAARRNVRHRILCQMCYRWKL